MHTKIMELELPESLKSLVAHVAVMRGVFGFGGDTLGGGRVPKYGTLAIENITCLSQEMSRISDGI